MGIMFLGLDPLKGWWDEMTIKGNRSFGNKVKNSISDQVVLADHKTKRRYRIDQEHPCSSGENE
jgi:hypothetical protein